MKIEFGTIYDELNSIYEEIKENAERSLFLSYFRRSSDLFTFAYTVYQGAIELEKDDVERESAYMNRNIDMTKKKLSLTVKDFYAPSDKVLLKNMLERAANLPLHQRISAIDELFGSNEIVGQIDNFIENAYSFSNLADENYLLELIVKTPEEIETIDDPFIQLAVALYPLYQEQKEIIKTHKGALDQLFSKLIDVKKEFQGSEFVPDANGTSRLTYGNIGGYSRHDAVDSYPITTIGDVAEKTTTEFPFNSPKRLVKLYKQRKFGRFGHPELGSVPVGILYNMDTTSGNSGSAVLNSRGELVGINFDRVYEATINDFAWSEDYSRSIAVDIRCVLWVLDIYSGADYLLEEMGVNH